ncbi:MAG: hypothetical protein EOP07_23295 [Proteobacteria bacterium]|nr:MAG: hypothetical protein EOP07_23295 [Pseudomonadota bacterium]
MKFFNSANYREIISSEILRNSQVKSYKKKMSEAGGFHAAYLSQVLTNSANITADQASLLCEFWDYDERMSEFFITLVSLEKATTASLRKRLEMRIASLRAIASPAEIAVKLESSLAFERAQLLFSSSDYYAVLAALSIPHVQSEIELSNFLRIHIENLRIILTQLHEMQLTKKKADYWEVASENNATVAHNKSLTHDLVSSLHAKFCQAYINTYHSMCDAAVIPVTAEQYNALKAEMRALMEKYHGALERNGEFVAGINVSLFRF